MGKRYALMSPDAVWERSRAASNGRWLAVDDWLGEEGEGTPADLVRPCPSDWLRLWPVDVRVGNVGNNDPGLLAGASAGRLL